LNDSAEWTVVHPVNPKLRGNDSHQGFTLLIQKVHYSAWLMWRSSLSSLEGYPAGVEFFSHSHSGFHCDSATLRETFLSHSSFLQRVTNVMLQL